MRVVGIIAECNPFHEGHAYLIQRAKEITGATYAVVILNGDFVQRGEPAIFDKYTRARAVLDGGADLVFELPVRFGISSAGDFALGGVMALNALGFVTDLCFGSECGNLSALQRVAGELYKESDSFHTALTKYLSAGLSYPHARAKALEDTWDFSADNGEKENLSALLHEPNNILGIEYCLALKKTCSTLIPHTIQREGMAYHATESKHSVFPSATALRKEIMTSSIPHLCLDDFSSVIGYALLSSKDLKKYKDIPEKLANRMNSRLNDFTTATEYIEDCRTRAFTEGRIRRGILQCMLGITRDCDGTFTSENSMPYLRLLGMKKGTSSLLSHSAKEGFTILSRLATDSKKLGREENALLSQDIFAADLYRQVWCRKYSEHRLNEYQHSLLIVE